MIESMDISELLSRLSGSSALGAESVGPECPMTLVYVSPSVHVVDVGGIGLEILERRPGGRFFVVQGDAGKRLVSEFESMAAGGADQDELDELFSSGCGTGSGTGTYH